MATPSPAIAIAGCGAVTALGAGLEPLAAALWANGSGLLPHARLGGRGYQSLVAGLIPEPVQETLRAAATGLPEGRAFRLAQAAMAQAEHGIPALFQAVPQTRRALVLSTTKADVEALERAVRGDALSTAARRHLQPALLAADLAECHGVRGPVQCVSAACISGLLALHQGLALLRRDQADLVLVVGVDLVSHFVLAGFSSLKSLDPDGCRPFDRSRVGLSLGEGAGALVLARAAMVPAPAVHPLGLGISDDANHLTGPSRDGSGLALAIQRALERAGVNAAQIDYVHVHGTGTPYNDAMEAHALRAVFGERVPPFSSSKGLLGHTLGAAGILETILCGLAFRAQKFPGTPRLADPDPVAAETLVQAPRPAGRLRRILKVNCGFAGTNAALVLGCDGGSGS